MDISLHLGVHRTGSTSLQVFMNDNRKLLARDKVAVWGPGRTRSGLFEGLIRDPDMLSEADQVLGDRSVQRIKMELDRARKNGMGRVVISEENMSGTMARNLRRCRLYDQVGPRLKRFAPAFEGHALRIGLAIRSYDTYWASALAFRVKGGEELPSAKKLDALTLQPRRWRHVVSDIAAVFPQAEICIWTFEGWMGLPQAQLNALTGTRLPHGLTNDTRLNNASLSSAEIGRIAQERGQHEAAKALLPQPGRYQPFDAQQLQKLRQDYATDLDWLTQGSDGLATYFDPAGGTFGGPQDARGSDHDQETELGRTG